MYFLGHMTWAYVFAMLAWAFIPGIKKTGKLFVPAILILGILPDSDLLLGSLGIVHRTVTHSFFLWILLFIPVFYFLRLKGIPYFIAVVQHFAFGDFIMGKVMMFWPFYTKFIGLGFGMPSLMDTVMEIAGLILAAGIIIYTGDLKRLLSVDKRNLYMIFPLLALVVSAIFFISHMTLNPFIQYVLSSQMLITMAIANFILLGFIAASTLQGLRALMRRKN